MKNALNECWFFRGVLLTRDDTRVFLTRRTGLESGGAAGVVPAGRSRHAQHMLGVMLAIADFLTRDLPKGFNLSADLGQDGSEGGLEIRVLLDSDVLVLLADGKVKRGDLGLQGLLEALDLLPIGLAQGRGQGVDVEAKSSDLTAELLAGLSPVLLLNIGSKLSVNAGNRLGDTLLGERGVSTGLGKAIALSLRQVKVTGLVDDVESLGLGGTVVDDVDGVGSRGGDSGREGGGTGEQGTAINLGTRDDGGPGLGNARLGGGGNDEPGRWSDGRGGGLVFVGFARRRIGGLGARGSCAARRCRG